MSIASIAGLSPESSSRFSALQGRLEKGRASIEERATRIQNLGADGPDRNPAFSLGAHSGENSISLHPSVLEKAESVKAIMAKFAMTKPKTEPAITAQQIEFKEATHIASPASIAKPVEETVRTPAG